MDKEADFSSQLKHARIYTQKHTHARNIDMFATTPSVSCAFTARDSRRASSQSAASSRCSSSSCSRSGCGFPLLKVFSFEGARGIRSDRGSITSIKREGGAHHHSFSRRREKKSISISKRRRQRENGLLFCPKAEADKEGEKEQPKRLSKKEAEEAARAALMGAIGNKKDKLKAFDNGGRGGGFFNFGGGGGGGGGSGDGSNKGTLQVLFLLFCVVFVFYGLKPVSAMFVNLIYYAFKIPTGRPGDEEPEDALSYAGGKAGQSADADVISKYGGDDDDDDDDDDE